MIVAEFTFGQALLTVLAVFVFVAWIMVLFSIIADLFRDHELSGWWKAVWIFFLIFVPFLTALVYLIARGDGMRNRAIKEQQEAQAQFDSYVRETAGVSQADQIAALAEQKEKGNLSEAEFEQAKAKVLDG
jgi:NADH:ubiquinone oxidoreductase subunit 6 (subunit J)